MRKLTAKQEKFIDEYLVDLNATQAAIRAGYSKKGARVTGCNTLANTNVQAAIKERREQLSCKAGVTQERIIEEYAKLAFLDPSKLFDSDGNLLPIQDMPKDVVAAIGGFDVVSSNGKDVVSKVKLIDKKGSLQDLARHLGMFEKDNEQGRDRTIKVIYEDSKGPIDD